MSKQIIRSTEYVKWKEVEYFPGYFVSNNGLVRMGKTLKTLLSKRSRKLKGTYYYVIFDNKEAKIKKAFDVHRLVWDHFGDRPFVKGCQIHHIDFNSANNNINNLQLINRLDHYSVHVAQRRKEVVNG